MARCFPYSWLPSQALGLFYFGGLYWTVRSIAGSRHPALLAMGSFLLRTALVVLALFFLTTGDWRPLAAALAGFLIVRTVLVRFWGRPEKAGMFLGERS